MIIETRSLLASWLFICLCMPVSGREGPPIPELPEAGPVVFRRPVVVDWPADMTPSAPDGFIVEKFAGDLAMPRWMHVLPNGDVLVSQARTESMGGLSDEQVAALTEQGLFGASEDKITLLRNRSGVVTRHVFAENLNQPFGMALLGDYLYVANTDALVRYRFEIGQTRLTDVGEKVVDIPAGEQSASWNNHWTRNVVVSPDRSSLFVSVGAATNVNESGDEHPERAAIWLVTPDGSEKRLFATGLRNPVGMDFHPETGELWTTVNERDGLGEEIPPDYLTRVVSGADYGWPYVYFGSYADPFHLERSPKKVAEAQRTARVPDLPIAAHSVPLGLLFYTGKQFPEKFRHGAFVARRGGVSRARFVGLDVLFVPFVDGSPQQPKTFVDGFVANIDRGTVYGRPVGLAMLPDGSLLITDDAGAAIWRVRYAPDEISER